MRDDVVDLADALAGEDHPHDLAGLAGRDRRVHAGHPTLGLLEILPTGADHLGGPADFGGHALVEVGELAVYGRVLGVLRRVGLRGRALPSFVGRRGLDRGLHLAEPCTAVERGHPLSGHHRRTWCAPATTSYRRRRVLHGSPPAGSRSPVYVPANPIEGANSSPGLTVGLPVPRSTVAGWASQPSGYVPWWWACSPGARRRVPVVRRNRGGHRKLSPAAPQTAQPEQPAQVQSVDAAALGATWRPGCPVPPAALRRITLSYFGFDGRSHRGELVVNRDAVSDVITIFAELYSARFPIEKMHTVDNYPRAEDELSMQDNNTSAFNCRQLPSGAWSCTPTAVRSTSTR